MNKPHAIVNILVTLNVNTQSGFIQLLFSNSSSVHHLSHSYLGIDVQQWENEDLCSMLQFVALGWRFSPGWAVTSNFLRYRLYLIRYFHLFPLTAIKLNYNKYFILNFCRPLESLSKKERCEIAQFKIYHMCHNLNFYRNIYKQAKREKLISCMDIKDFM